MGGETLKSKFDRVEKALNAIPDDFLGAAADHFAAWFEDHGIPVVVVRGEVVAYEPEEKPKQGSLFGD